LDRACATNAAFALAAYARGQQAKIFASASQADLQRRIAMKVARYSSAGVDSETPHAKLPSDFAWRMCSDDEVCCAVARFDQRQRAVSATALM
jgi:hypothetical protein